MLHTVANYTDSDLRVAISSPYVSNKLKEEIEHEIMERRWIDFMQYEVVRLHNLK